MRLELLDTCERFVSHLDMPDDTPEGVRAFLAEEVWPEEYYRRIKAVRITWGVGQRIIMVRRPATAYGPGHMPLLRPEVQSVHAPRSLPVSHGLCACRVLPELHWPEECADIRSMGVVRMPRRRG